MNAAAEEKSYRFDTPKWLLVTLVVGGGIYGNYYYGAEPVLYRAIGLIVLAAVAVAIAMQTAKGAAVWNLAKGARVEVGRVVWPTRNERNQTTLVVVGFIFVMALILWGLDALFGWIAAGIIG